MKLEIWCGWAHPYKTIAKFIVHSIVLGFNDKMLMKVPMSLEMWMQCGPSHVKCGCNVDPPHLHILNVDVMWSNVDVLWSNVDFHISNVNKYRYIVGQHNGDLR